MLAWTAAGRCLAGIGGMAIVAGVFLVGGASQWLPPYLALVLFGGIGLGLLPTMAYGC